MHTGRVDAGTWGIVAVLVVGTAVVAYGWLSDRAATKRQQELLASPPERVIPRFHPDEPRPRYLSELEAAVRPDHLPPTHLGQQVRDELGTRLRGAPAFPVGWASKGFVTDSDAGWAVLRHPLILVCEDELATVRELLPTLQHAQEVARPIVVVAPKADGDVIATLQANAVQGKLECLLVLLPSRDQRRSLCSLTGAQPLATSDLRSGWLPLSHLGECETWVSDKSTSWVLLESQPSSSTQGSKAKLK